MTNKEFCRIVTQAGGEEIDSIKQIKLRNFNGEELKEWLETAIEVIRSCAELPTCYSTELNKINQLQQTQASTRHQLEVLRVFANKLVNKSANYF